MKSNRNLLKIAAFIALIISLILAGGTWAAIDGGYVGSAACGTCHSRIKADFDKSGHPYKVRFTNGATPTAVSDPLSYLLIGYTPTLGTLSTLTNNTLMVDDGTGRLDWSAVSYVIGGYGWKARWGILDVTDADGDGVNDTGYVWTGSGAQYNMLANNYSAYNAGTDKKYSCAICHNTNGTSSVDAGCITALDSGRTEPWASSGRTPAAPGGFRSEWTFSGVQCEACHGAGNTHAGAPSKNNIVKNTSKNVCGKCHIRATNTNGFGGECGGNASASILTNGAQNNGGTSLANQTVQHHEQYNELVGYNGDGAHATLDCVTCHDPHKRSHKVTDAIAGALQITDNALSGEARDAVVSCNKCHYGKDLAGAANIAGHASMACIDCHMAEITKSATAAVGTWGVKGDVKGHIFAIDPAATSMDRTNADGKHIATNKMTVNFACGKCHDSAVGTATGVASAAAASAAATNYHADEPLRCTTCHAKDIDNMNHPTGSRTPAGLAGDNESVACEICHMTYSSYPSASWVDFACGQCHGGSSGPSATLNGVPYMSKAYLVVYAENIHINSAPAVSRDIDVSSYTVTITDTSTDDKAFPANAVKVQWGDGTSSTGDAGSDFEHTYGADGKYQIVYRVKDSDGRSSRIYKYVYMPERFSIVVNLSPALSSKATFVLKKNGVFKSEGTGKTSYTFTKLKPGTYQVKIKKPGYAFDGDDVTEGDQNPLTVVVGASDQTVTFTHTP